MEDLRKIISQSGTQKDFADKIGASQSAVANWLNRRRKVPVSLFDKIEEVTNGAITRQDLRPDIFN